MLLIFFYISNFEIHDNYLTYAILFVFRLVVSIAWVAHIIIYLLIDPPLSAFLNEVFIKLDDIWGNLDFGISSTLLAPSLNFLFVDEYLLK